MTGAEDVIRRLVAQLGDAADFHFARKYVDCIVEEYAGKLATLGATDANPTQAESSGTCHDKGNIERFICSECGCRLDLQDDDWEATMWLDDGTAMVPRFCPNCGRKVVSE